MNSLSEFVKEQRKKTNLSQKKFAKQTGVPLTLVREIERKKSDLNLEKVIYVLEIFEHILEPASSNEPVFKKEITDKEKKKELRAWKIRDVALLSIYD